MAFRIRDAQKGLLSLGSFALLGILSDIVVLIEKVYLSPYFSFCFLNFASVTCFLRVNHYLVVYLNPFFYP